MPMHYIADDAEAPVTSREPDQIPDGSDTNRRSGQSSARI
jgi:hypothetical protein